MIHVARLDARALVIADVPWPDDERHAAVGEIMIRVSGGLFRLFQLVDLAVELRQPPGIERAEREVADRARLLPLALDVDFRAVRHTLLGKIKDVAFGVVRADAGE